MGGEVPAAASSPCGRREKKEVDGLEARQWAGVCPRSPLPSFRRKPG